MAKKIFCRRASLDSLSSECDEDFPEQQNFVEVFLHSKKQTIPMNTESHMNNVWNYVSKNYLNSSSADDALSEVPVNSNFDFVIPHSCLFDIAKEKNLTQKERSSENFINLVSSEGKIIDNFVKEVEKARNLSVGLDNISKEKGFPAVALQSVVHLVNEKAKSPKINTDDKNLDIPYCDVNFKANLQNYSKRSVRQASSTVNVSQSEKRQRSKVHILSEKSFLNSKNKAHKVKCTECRQYVESKTEMYFHRIAHSFNDFKNMECRLCGESQYTCAGLKQHMDLKHGTSYERICPICPNMKLFRHKKSFMSHITRFHLSSALKVPLIFSCKVCNSIFPSKVSLGKHMNSSHTVPTEISQRYHMFNCDKCGEGYDQPMGLRKHVLKEH